MARCGPVRYSITFEYVVKYTLGRIFINQIEHYILGLFGYLELIYVKKKENDYRMTPTCSSSVRDKNSM